MMPRMMEMAREIKRLQNQKSRCDKTPIGENCPRAYLIEEVDRVDVVFEDREFQELRARLHENGLELARLPVRPLVRIERQVSGIFEK
jgi:hypothetical protein